MRFACLLLLVMMSLQLSGCGKRAHHLDPPNGSTEQYPKRYPPPDSPGANL